MRAQPLLDWSRHPDVCSMEAAQVQPAVDALLERLEREVSALEQAPEPSWEGLMRPLEAVQDALHRTQSVLSMVMSLMSPEGWSDACALARPALAAFEDRVGQSRVLYEGMQALLEARGDSLSPARRRVLEQALLRARLQGVDQSAKVRARLVEISSELSVLSTRFSANMLESGRAWSLRLDDPARLEGLPDSWRSMAAAQSRRAGEEQATAEAGPWTVTLDAPLYFPVLLHGRDRELRRTLRLAWAVRAATGEHSNVPVLEQILALRAERSAQLGFDSFADMALTERMAESPAQVRELLQALLEHAKPRAQQELEEQTDLARQAGAPVPLCHWDRGFWGKRLQEQRAGIRDEELRPYLPFDHVLDVLFSLVERLFAVRIVRRVPPVAVWDEQVRLYELRDVATGAPLAEFYLDAFARPGQKRGGAWMSDLVVRSASLAAPGEPHRRPVALLVCNQTPPDDRGLSLMTLNEVRTLFHEMGHTLQHCLSTVDELGASGIQGVEWDAVELPSTFLERWLYDPQVLNQLTRHHETGEALPKALQETVLAARNFGVGNGTSAQVELSLIDLSLHDGEHQEQDPFELCRAIGAQVRVLKPLDEDRFLCSFGHLFSGGYAAGYYSYLWAHVLAADAYAAFAELPEQERPQAGARFRDTVLGLGGSAHPSQVFTAFRGRAPQLDALLLDRGLVSA